MTYFTSTDQFVLMPALLLSIFGCAVLLFEFLLPKGASSRNWLLAVTLLGLGFTGRALWLQQQAIATAPGGRIVGFSGSVTIDGFGLFFNWVFLATAAIVVLISYRYLEIEHEHRSEYYGLILFAQCGMFFLAMGSDLVTLFVALELMALSFYVMVGFLREQRRGNEAAMKYFLLGGFSSGFLAYGFSLLYGLSGSTNIHEIAEMIARRNASDPLLILALVTTSVGLLFKISAAPFHMWAPDAYEGAPTAVTAYLSVGSKAASFAILVRVFQETLPHTRESWEPLLAGAAVLSMTVGNLAAMSQTNLKRLLAYSSISHAGYILLGLIAGNDTGLRGIGVYILTYAFTNLGALLVVLSLRRRDPSIDPANYEEDLTDLSGLARRNPTYALFMLIFLLSLAGIPPTAGFLGKYYVLLSLIETGHYALAVIAALYVAVAVYYYFRIVRSMYLEKPSREYMLASSAGLRVALAVTGALTIGIGLFPEPFLRMAGWSVLR
jgi:NADH-quinone oxidoreductase subunit N